MDNFKGADTVRCKTAAKDAAVLPRDGIYRESLYTACLGYALPWLQLAVACQAWFGFFRLVFRQCSHYTLLAACCFFTPPIISSLSFRRPQAALPEFAFPVKGCNTIEASFLQHFYGLHLTLSPPLVGAYTVPIYRSATIMCVPLRPGTQDS